jgi:hypothetical protein
MTDPIIPTLAMFIFTLNPLSVQQWNSNWNLMECNQQLQAHLYHDYYYEMDISKYPVMFGCGLQEDVDKLQSEFHKKYYKKD